MLRRPLGLLLFLTFLPAGCGAPETPAASARRTAPSPPHYSVSVDAELTRIDVSVCFEGRPPSSLEAIDRAAPDCLLEARGPGGVPLRIGDHSILLYGIADGGCVDYAVDVDRALGLSRWQWRREDALLLSPSLWLWRPSTPEPSARLETSLPEGMAFASPWPRDEDGLHRLDASAFHRPSHVVFGRFETERWQAFGSSFELVRLDGELRATSADLRTWIDAAVGAVASLTGRFPVPHLLLVIVPAGDGTRPVAFGLVHRGGGASVMLIPNRNAEPDALVADWTAVHELSHLALPRLSSSSSWLAEGFATYYQEVLRTRAGMQSPEQGWTRILDGFDRGRPDGTSRRLTDESAEMHRTGAYLRVYWSGAAFFLASDVALRRSLSASLDQQIHGLLSRGWDRTHAMSHADLAQELDTGLSAPYFARAIHESAELREFPAVEPTLRELGVVRDAEGEVILDPDAPLAALRDAIMAPSLSGGSSR